MDNKIEKWKESNLKNYLSRNPNISIGNKQLNQIELWLRSENSERHRKRIERLSVPDALRLSQHWGSRQLTLMKPYTYDLGSILIRKYDSGFQWVKLNHANSFSYEGQLMDHCVVDYKHKTDSLIFSLRNIHNFPICTVQVLKTGELVQFRGRSNLKVDPSYYPYLIDLLITNPIIKLNKSKEDILLLGYCFNRNQLHKLDDLAEEMRIKHSVQLVSVKLPHLKCKKMIIWGNMDLVNLAIEELPENLIVYGNLNITHCHKLKKLPRTLHVTGTISIDSCHVLELLPLYLKTKILQFTNCGNIYWDKPVNLCIDQELNCYKTKINDQITNKFNIVSEQDSWKSYKIKFHQRIIETSKFIFNLSQKVFDLFSHY